MPVSDATPIIYMAKLDQLQLLKEIFTHVQIPSEVKMEAVDRGKVKGFPDAYMIEQALNEGWLISSSLTPENIKKSETLAQMTGIDVGEAQAIILTRQKNEKLVFMDQTNARQVARHLGLAPRGTIFIVLTAIRKRLITREQAKQILEMLIEVNFYISAKIYRDTLKAIEHL